MHVTEVSIDDTVYIVESISSEDATETVYEQIRRLILSHANDLEAA